MADCLIRFQQDISHISIPERFTFPFYYDVDPLAAIAAEELMAYIESVPWDHNFGFSAEVTGLPIGKMFGVLVVRDREGQLGYIAAYSGKIEGHIPEQAFVPSIFQLHQQDYYYPKEEKKLEELSAEISQIEHDPTYLRLKAHIHELVADHESKISLQKKKHKINKEQRKQDRMAIDDPEILTTIHHIHKQESINDAFLLKEYKIYLDQKIKPLQDRLRQYDNRIQSLRDERKAKSIQLQEWLFRQYNFLNAQGDEVNVKSLFAQRIPSVPPSGAGDCAAPKLLQYAYTHSLSPICMAEFWWGQSPSSLIRQHRQYYPACRGKCEPILTHMLQGLDVDPNPLESHDTSSIEMTIVYDDEYMCIVDKPAEFLSVPGKHITDCVQERIKKRSPDSTGPLIVHRLDMSTSGLLLIAKSKGIHKKLQQQFVTRAVRKRYVALLDGHVKSDTGYIDLPLAPDHYNRPYQVVSSEGKSARTRYEVIHRDQGMTRVHLYPITGRTHQLRIHMAHTQGLDTPIIGDDLYGIRADRLYLHAESISFTHPVTGDELTISAPAPF